MNGHVTTRRGFLKVTAGVAGAMVASAIPAQAQAATGSKRVLTAVDQVTLGKTGIKLSRLGMGCGSNSGNVQRALGHDGFTRLLRYAYDQGITYIDTAESYKTHEYIREAIKGIPREKLFIQTKMSANGDPVEKLDRFRRELGVEYIDSLLTHCAVNANWDEERKRFLDAFEEAKQKGIIRAHGVSCHSLPALARAAAIDWCDVHLVRLNPQGVWMDTPAETWNAQSGVSHVPAVIEQVGIMRQKQRGIIGMKLSGNGDFTKFEDRRRAVHFAMKCGLLDAVTIGFKNTTEIDEAIKLMNEALAEVAA